MELSFNKLNLAEIVVHRSSAQRADFVRSIFFLNCSNPFKLVTSFVDFWSVLKLDCEHSTARNSSNAFIERKERNRYFTRISILKMFYKKKDEFKIWKIG